MLIFVGNADTGAAISNAQFSGALWTYEGNGIYEVPYGQDEPFTVAAPGYIGNFDGNSGDDEFQRVYLTPAPPPPPPPSNCNCWS